MHVNIQIELNFKLVQGGDLRKTTISSLVQKGKTGRDQGFSRGFKRLHVTYLRCSSCHSRALACTCNLKLAASILRFLSSMTFSSKNSISTSSHASLQIIKKIM